MKPQEVTDALKLSTLKDKIWFVVPSCATTGEGLLEGLVILHYIHSYILQSLTPSRPGSQPTSNPHRRRRTRIPPLTQSSHTIPPTRHHENKWRRTRPQRERARYFLVTTHAAIWKFNTIPQPNWRRYQNHNFLPFHSENAASSWRDFELMLYYYFLGF